MDERVYIKVIVEVTTDVGEEVNKDEPSYYHELYIPINRFF